MNLCEYDKKEKIGEGSQSLIFVVERKGEKYALKDTIPNITLPDSMEIDICFRLHCNNLIHGEDLILKSDCPFIDRLGIILPLASYNLGSIINEKRTDLLFYVAIGLQALHSQNILHCDMKLENVLMVNDGIKISDFGGAMMVPNINESVIASPFGSPLYTSVENMNDRLRPYSYKNDIYSYGVMLYYTALGYEPSFDDKNAPSKYAARSIDELKSILTFLLSEEGLRQNISDENLRSLIGRCCGVFGKIPHAIDIINDPYFTSLSSTLEVRFGVRLEVPNRIVFGTSFIIDSSNEILMNQVNEDFVALSSLLTEYDYYYPFKELVLLAIDIYVRFSYVFHSYSSNKELNINRELTIYASKFIALNIFKYFKSIYKLSKSNDMLNQCYIISKALGGSLYHKTMNFYFKYISMEDSEEYIRQIKRMFRVGVKDYFKLLYM
jgi:serine/threonine protein kinase